MTTEQRVSECGCPSWTLRCAHWDGAGVVLVGLHNTEHDNHCRSDYAVYSMAEWRPCPFCGDLGSDAFTPNFYWGDDLEDALSAFAAAEAQLLGRDL